MEQMKEDEKPSGLSYRYFLYWGEYPTYGLGLMFRRTFQAIPYACVSLGTRGVRSGFGLRLGFAWFRLSFSRKWEKGYGPMRYFYASPTLTIRGLRCRYNGWSKLEIPNGTFIVDIEQNQNGGSNETNGTI